MPGDSGDAAAGAAAAANAMVFARIMPPPPVQRVRSTGGCCQPTVETLLVARGPWNTKDQRRVINSRITWQRGPRERSGLPGYPGDLRDRQPAQGRHGARRHSADAQQSGRTPRGPAGHCPVRPESRPVRADGPGAFHCGTKHRDGQRSRAAVPGDPAGLLGQGRARQDRDFAGPGARAAARHRGRDFRAVPEISASSS